MTFKGLLSLENKIVFSIFIDIPEGEHEVHINSSESAYIRILALNESDYLFPDLNETETTVSDARKIYAENLLNNDDIFSLSYSFI